MCLRKFRLLPLSGLCRLRLWQRAENLLIEDFRRDAARDGSPHMPTISARHLPGHRIEVEGVTAEQAGQIAAASNDVELATAPVVDGSPQLGLAVAAKLGRESILTMPAGGFSRLWLGRAE